MGTRTMDIATSTSSRSPSKAIITVVAALIGTCLLAFAVSSFAFRDHPYGAAPTQLTVSNSSSAPTTCPSGTQVRNYLSLQTENSPCQTYGGGGRRRTYYDSYDSRRRGYYSGSVNDDDDDNGCQCNSGDIAYGNQCRGQETVTDHTMETTSRNQCSAHCCSSTDTTYKCCGYTIDTWGFNGKATLPCDCNSAVKGGAFSLLAAVAVVAAMQLQRD